MNIFGDDVGRFEKAHKQALSIFEETKNKLEKILDGLAEAIHRRGGKIVKLSLEIDVLNSERASLEEKNTEVRHSLDKIQEFLA